MPSFLPSPKIAGYAQDVSSLLERILSVHTRGTMVLFTSHQMLRQVYRTLAPAMDTAGVRLLAQGVNGSRTALLSQFQQDERSVLLGTSSFWEGVDVPGAALELLVITKLPFSVPTDPVFGARMEQTERETGNGFINFAVPEAVIMLRQGIGRLIRSAGDKGAVLALDNRLVQTAYGSRFLASLPMEAEICSTEEAMLNHLNQWFA